VYRDVRPCDDPSFEPSFVEYHVTSHVFIDDNDTDGLTDDLEYLFRSDPNQADTDGDGLTDKEEWDLRQDESLYNPEGLSATRADSDGDCLSDFDEVSGFDLAPYGRVSTDPSGPDTDLDDLDDYDEIFVVGSNPVNGDTDADGVPDGWDVHPLRDLAVWFRLTEVRFESHPSGGQEANVAYSGHVHGTEIGLDPPARFVTGQWEGVPSTAGVGWFDIDDRVGEQLFYIQVYWAEFDGEGNFLGDYNFNPGTRSHPLMFIRVFPLTDTWSVILEGELGAEDERFSTPGNSCEVVGPDGGFRFEIKMGSASDDPAELKSLCV
jgi:hypothetical protein